MVRSQKRNISDIFGWPLVGLIFKNRAALFAVRTVTMMLFASALYFGFAYPELSENPYTTAIFWSLFWPFFMIVSIVALGPGFCGICPHGVMGRWMMAEETRYRSDHPGHPLLAAGLPVTRCPKDTFGRLVTFFAFDNDRSTQLLYVQRYGLLQLPLSYRCRDKNLRQDRSGQAHNLPERLSRV